MTPYHGLSVQSDVFLVKQDRARVASGRKGTRGIFVIVRKIHTRASDSPVLIPQQHLPLPSALASLYRAAKVFRVTRSKRRREMKMFPAHSPRIRHRSELTERDWKNAVKGLGKHLPQVGDKKKQTNKQGKQTKKKTLNASLAQTFLHQRSRRKQPMVYLGVVWTCRHNAPVLSNHQFQLALLLSHQTAKIIDFSLVLFFKFINLLFFLSQSGGIRKESQQSDSQRAKATGTRASVQQSLGAPLVLRATRALKRVSRASMGFLGSNNQDVSNFMTQMPVTSCNKLQFWYKLFVCFKICISVTRSRDGKGILIICQLLVTFKFPFKEFNISLASVISSRPGKQKTARIENIPSCNQSNFVSGLFSVFLIEMRKSSISSKRILAHERKAVYIALTDVYEYIYPLDQTNYKPDNSTRCTCPLK